MFLSFDYTGGWCSAMCQHFVIPYLILRQHWCLDAPCYVLCSGLCIVNSWTNATMNVIGCLLRKGFLFLHIFPGEL